MKYRAMKSISVPILAVLALACSWPVPAITYYTAVEGNDANPGTSAQPWRTIQKAVSAAAAGDTVIVRPGTYPERITTVRGGADESRRITFQAEGEVTMRGWVINHPYITVRGFRVRQWSGPTIQDAKIRFGENGKYALVEYCIIRGDLQTTRTDMMFQAANNTISSATGGFFEVGFTNGQTLSVWAGTNGLSIHSANRGPFTITEVTDTTLTVAGNLVDQGPLHIYLTAAYVYGLHFHSRSEGVMIRSNTFSNLGYDNLFFAGTGHQFLNNVVEQCNGWDIVRYTGSNHVFGGNWFRDSPLIVYQVSPDFSENWPTRYENILFTSNFVENVVAVISSQKYNTTVSGPITYARNVFIGTGRFSGVFPNTTFEHNTFLRVASQRNPVISVARHPLYFATANYATNAVIRNNIFVECGEVQYPWTEDTMGWYEINGSADSVVAEGNFVAGGAPGYGAKIGWPESEFLNGGDPGFLNIQDPLGPDGIPFTADDGLRLLPTSKLVLAGAGGHTIGAYELPGGGQPLLMAQLISSNQLRLTWPQTVETWTLQSAASVQADWIHVPELPQWDNGQFSVILGTTNLAAFYRLIR